MTGHAFAHRWFALTNSLAAGALTVLSAALAFNLGSALGIVYYEEQAYALGVGLTLFLVFHRRRGGAAAVPEAALAWALLAMTAYFAVHFDRYSMAVAFQPPEIVYGGAVVILALLEAVRRVAGWPLVLVILAIMAYTLLGQHLPSDFAAPPTDLTSMTIYVAADANSILGSPIAVAIVVVLPFLFMGNLLGRSGGAQYFTDLSLALFGRSPGGPAKVAVVSSGLQGAISGSAVANVASSGVMTIPMMKQAGYTPERAGAIEAVASTGGQLVPPVMGAAAFLMAEFLKISYAEIVLAAIIPSLLYYGSLFLAVHLMAQRDQLGRIDPDVERTARILKRGWFFLLGLGGLLLLLPFGGWRPEAAAFAAAAFFALCGLLIGYRGARMRPAELLASLSDTGRTAVDVLVISAAAGIVVGLLNVSGLSFSLSMFLIALARDSVVLLLAYTAVVSILLGMGMPTTGVYVLLATIVAPALVQLGILPLAAHFFIFYFGMMSMITPPVAMAAFAAASISGAKPMATGWTAMLIGWPAFILPFLMTETPELLFVGPLPLVLLEGALAVVGVAAVTAAGLGYWRRRLGAAQRLALGGLGAVALASVTTASPELAMAVRVAAAAGLLAWMAGAPVAFLRRAAAQTDGNRT
ncbi:TRAP transporter fused permease subunit [Arenibaculum sp.]|jgi:TRAP transporter 4TM/12TM fusion protein|uniref:TRAP transporter permease n=1 Tax=Arenibaculum sp. TaxID=2865862 RepID=UPI002E12F355|nr:TRAP transporter fused permease subunit [Arenibaculum sp.]